MKIAFAQLNYHIGNFNQNVDKITFHIKKAKAEGAELVLFSELSVCGYHPNDLLERKSFMVDVEAAIQRIAADCIGIAALVGAPTLNDSNKGKKLRNSAIFIADGQVQHIINKTLLPTYDIFDEYRHFEPNDTFKIIEYKGERLAVTICEDLWDNQPTNNDFAQSRLYIKSPIEELKKQNPDIVLNLSASPFSYDQADNRKEILLNNAKTHNLPIAYVNQVGGQTELVFDGGSLFVNAEGAVEKELKYFEEDFLIVDTKSSGKKQLQPQCSTIGKIHDALILGMKDYFGKMGFKSATLGLSGGIDSAVVVVLAVRALGRENVRVLLMPSKYSSDHSITDAEELANNLGIEHQTINIQKMVDDFDVALNPIFGDLPFDVTEENIQARTRGVLMMALSNKFGNILLNTTNKSECAVGYGTLYGDMNGGLSVLGDVYKKDVFKLSRYINKDGEIIPENTIVKPPSAELRPDQKDSDSLPDYDTLDSILFQYIEQNRSFDEIEANGYDRTTIERTAQMVDRNEYKRFQSPPILRVSSKAFGFGRRIPLVAKYR